MKPIRILVSLLCLCTAAIADVTGPNFVMARSMGMGGAFVAVADDRTALYHNPAGLNVQKFKMAITLPALSINYDPDSYEVGILTGQRIGNFTNPGAINSSFVNSLKRIEGKHINNMILPEADFVFKNFGFGVYGVSCLDASFHRGLYDPYLTYNSRTDVVGKAAISKRLFRTLSVGAAFNYVFRLESPPQIVWGEQISKIQIGELFSNPQDTLDLQEEIKQGFGFDAGAIYHFGFLRAGGVVKNIAAKIGDDDVKTDLDLGVGYWIPQLMHRGMLDRVVIAADVQNLLADKNFWTKMHLGATAELPIGAVRVGLNQGYPAWGFDVSFMVFHFEFASYGQELGEYPGHIKDQNYLLTFRFGF